MFKELSEIIGEGHILNMTISKKGDKLSISILPQQKDLKDEAKNNLTPIVMSGKPEDIDAEFISTLEKPLGKVVGLLTNMKQFEDSAEKVEAEKKEQKKKKEEEDKKAADRKKKYDKHISNADAFEKEDKLNDSLNELLKAKVYADDKQLEKLKKRIAEMQLKTGQKSLFGGESNEMQQQSAEEEEVKEEENDEEEGGEEYENENNNDDEEE